MVEASDTIEDNNRRTTETHLRSQSHPGLEVSRFAAKELDSKNLVSNINELLKLQINHSRRVLLDSRQDSCHNNDQEDYDQQTDEMGNNKGG